MLEVQEYVENIEEKWRPAYRKLAEVIEKNIPDGFVLQMQYGMPTYVVPLEIFPAGYLGRKDEALPFISLAAQKKYLALYHMGIMGDKEMLSWFQEAYERIVPTKLNMGKSCIRFSNPKNIPYELIGKLVSKVSTEAWIERYVRYTDR